MYRNTDISITFICRLIFGRFPPRAMIEVGKSHFSHQEGNLREGESLRYSVRALKTPSSLQFPGNFTWGAATASYQIEGAWDADGKGASIWDMFSHDGKVWGRHTGDVACDHYHRYPEDIALMRRIGLQAYRFSFAWPRIIPDGVGATNDRGLDFYDRLVDALLEAGITPWATLYHWDLPYQLFLRGGWLNPDAPKWFADYAAVIVARFSDRIRHWITLNEPQCFIGLGYFTGAQHAPGLSVSLRETLLAAHHCLLAHGMAAQVIRAGTKAPARIGWAPVGAGYSPATESPEDQAAAMLAMAEVHPDSVWNATWWADPVVLGHYPTAGLEAYGSAVPKFTDAEMRTIRQPLDFYGCNVYSNGIVKAGPDGRPVAAPLPAGHPHTHFMWAMTPDALYWTPKFLQERYKLPIVITENGLSHADWVADDGRVHDAGRIDFLGKYLRQLHRAIAEGVDVEGYFHWSLMDNFEWGEGYKHRFGLIHIDYQTLKRTLKDSGSWYAEVIRTNGASLG